MSIEYLVYWGDPPTTFLGRTSGLALDTPPLAPGSYAFQVRARDTLTGLVDQNGDARLAVTVGPDGSDRTGLPDPPAGVSAAARAGGSARVAWVYSPGGQGGAPAGFRVYAGVGSPDYGAVLATVAYTPSSPARHYLATVSGLTGGTAYRVAVRAFNAAGEEQNLATATVTALGSGPAAVPSLSASVTP